MRASSSHQDGFTLLELMVALAIFMLIGIGAHGMLRSLIQTQNAVRQRALHLQQAQRAFSVIEQDITQALPQSFDFASTAYAVSFTRRGWNNPLQLPRGDTEHVAYAVENGNLRRYYWSDDAPGTPAARQTLLENSEDFHIAPQGAAMEVRVTLPQLGPLRRVMCPASP